LCSWCKEQRDEGFRQRHAQSGIPQDKRRADASSAEAQSESTQPAGTLQTGELADERGKTALIVARFDLEDWLKGDLLHTLFITSPQDVAQSQDLTDASDWDWRRLRTMLQLKETALAELDAYEAAVKQAEDTLNSKCKDLREQHKQEDGEKN